MKNLFKVNEEKNTVECICGGNTTLSAKGWACVKCPNTSEKSATYVPIVNKEFSKEFNIYNEIDLVSKIIEMKIEPSILHEIGFNIYIGVQSVKEQKNLEYALQEYTDTQSFNFINDPKFFNNGVEFYEENILYTKMWREQIRRQSLFYASLALQKLESLGYTIQKIDTPKPTES